MKEIDQEFEKLLKSKMDELSGSVDCFDRIAAAAYAKDDQDFSEDGLIISDLETVSSPHKSISVLKWTAVAAAAVVCISVIPVSGLIPRLFSTNNGNSPNNGFQAIISEMNEEIENGDFDVIDVPLDYYIKNDVLVTPLFSCPFEESSDQDMNVRIFIRQYDGLNTNQVYAVEYSGTYSEDNIMAAAASRYKFTERDMTYLNVRDCNGIFDFQSFRAAIQANFRRDGETYDDKNGLLVTVASFAQPMFFKDDNGNIVDMTADVLYGHVEDGTYVYDMRTYTSNGIDEDGNTVFSEFKVPDRGDMWESSLFFNGNSTKPDKNASNFTRDTFFNKPEVSWGGNLCPKAIAPLEPNGDICTTAYTVETYTGLNSYGNMIDRYKSTILPPAGLKERYMMLIYHLPSTKDYYCRVNSGSDTICNREVTSEPVENYQQEMWEAFKTVRHLSYSKNN